MRVPSKSRSPEKDMDLYEKVKNKTKTQKREIQKFEVENIFISKKHLEEPIENTAFRNSFSNKKL